MRDIDWKFALGALLGIAIGVGCRLLGIPSPAPPALVGALLVVAMTSGYVLADRFIARREARNVAHCGGPSGRGVDGARR